jgi:hypothetical protein
MLQLAAAPPPPQASASPQGTQFLSGRVECRIVDAATNVSTLSFDYGSNSITVVQGAGLARNGASAKAKTAINQLGAIRLRRTTFEDSSAGTTTHYDLTEMVGSGHRANRLTVLTQSGGLKDAGGGLAIAVSQLAATGMCKAAPKQERR